jgi:solute carrier family 25 carnitine/acylcarnitine transporter 20/29
MMMPLTPLPHALTTKSPLAHSTMGFREVTAATGAGIVTTIVGHPLDTIKVHLQTNHGLKGTWDATKELVHKRSLFRGILPPLANGIIMNTVMFSVFKRIKTATGDDSIRSAMQAGMVSGFATAFISTPTDFVKIKAQLNDVRSLDVLKSTPPAHLFRGHLANLGREGVFTMVYLGLYDQMNPTGFWQIAAASSLTGGLAWVISYPFDTVKTLMQSSSTLTYRGAMVQIGNVAGYYRGCGASTGRAIMVTSLRMIVYESIMNQG